MKAQYLASVRDVFDRPVDFLDSEHCCIDVGGCKFLIDAIWLDRVLAGKCYVQDNGYLVLIEASGGHRLFHRMVVPVLSGYMVDHANRNRTDNRSCNLRRVHPSQNNHNRERANKNGFRGIRARSGGFEVSIRFNCKAIYVGFFGSAKEAARAYDRKAVELVGGCAVTNFPVSDYEIPETCEADRLPVKPLKRKSKRLPCVVCNLRLGKGERGLCDNCRNKERRRERAKEDGREVLVYAPRVSSATETCTHDGCSRSVFARNLCEPHWREAKKIENPGKVKKDRAPRKLCSIRGCTKQAVDGLDGMCTAHHNAKHGIVKKHTGRPPKAKVQCSHPGCQRADASAITKLCPEHYHREYYAENADKWEVKEPGARNEEIKVVVRRKGSES